jgi:hypothetical protein
MAESLTAGTGRLMSTDTEYRPCHCGADCPWIGVRDQEPCWGLVEPMEDCGTEGFIHACQGHYDLNVGKPYIPRPRDLC